MTTTTATTTKKAKLALVTGASSGIGKALAQHHAAEGGDLVVVARRREALEALKKELEEAHPGISVTVVTADLGQPDGAAKLHAAVKELKLEVDYLINNAGLGGLGGILERNVADDLNMIQVNVSSLVALTHLFARDMVERGTGGKILNVGSTAGFMPGPYQATYFATKAFVNSFSQAIDQELRDKGVTCTVLAPGFVETEFAQVSGLDRLEIAKKGGATAKSVAALGYKAMVKEQLVTINEYGLSFLLQWVMPFLPRRMVLQMGEKLMKE